MNLWKIANFIDKSGLISSVEGRYGSYGSIHLFLCTLGYHIKKMPMSFKNAYKNIKKTCIDKLLASTEDVTGYLD